MGKYPRKLEECWSRIKELENKLSQIKQIMLEAVGEDKVHSQLCKKSVGDNYGKKGAFEKNCGCIAYGYNQRGAEIRGRIEKL
jgi:hypothetical protein